MSTQPIRNIQVLSSDSGTPWPHTSLTYHCYWDWSGPSHTSSLWDEVKARTGEGKKEETGHRWRIEGRGVKVFHKGTQVPQSKSFFFISNKRSIFPFYNFKYFEGKMPKHLSVLCFYIFIWHLSHFFSSPLIYQINKLILYTQFSLLFGFSFAFCCSAYAIIGKVA